MRQRVSQNNRAANFAHGLELGRQSLAFIKSDFLVVARGTLSFAMPEPTASRFTLARYASDGDVVGRVDIGRQGSLATLVAAVGDVVSSCISHAYI
jgi:hypothetical protein